MTNGSRPESAGDESELPADEQAFAIEVLSARVAELDDLWRRAVADLENYRKRMGREAELARLDERARVTSAILPILDNLDLALQHAESDSSSIVEGLRAVRDQAISVVASLGYPRYDETDVPFDPTQHEAVAVIDDPDAEPGTVVQVIRPGYGAGDKQLRPASVVVAASGSR